MFDVFKWLDDLTARAHMLEGTINPKTGKLYAKEEIARALGIIDAGGNLATTLVLHSEETPNKQHKDTNKQSKSNNIFESTDSAFDTNKIDDDKEDGQ